MAYPTTIDTPATPGAKLSSNPHSSLHTATNTSIVAIETKLGIDSSAAPTSIDYLLKNTSSSDPGHKHTLSSLSDFSVSGSTSGDVLQFNGTKYANKSGLVKFGGTGTDGALNITSGTTTINLGGASKVIKNYSSISITNTGSLAFSNPHANGTVIILKSQGNVSLTSSATPLIDASGMGASGGAVSSSGNGNTGSSGITTYGSILTGGAGAVGSTGGAFGVTISPAFPTTYIYRNLYIACGAGGGSGASLNSLNSGAGGNGGAGLIIECAGALNFTTTSGISVSGKNGSAAQNNASGGGLGGGGGGGAGMAVLLYNTLTANTGTITSAGGSGGSGGTGVSGTSRGGGGGGASVTANGAVGSDGVGTANPPGGNGGAGGSTSGIFTAVLNTEFT